MVGGIEELEKIEKTRLGLSAIWQEVKNFFSWLKNDFISLIFLIIGLFSLAYGLWLSREVYFLNHQEKLRQKIIVVDIGGAVKKPGVYSCQSGDRVINLINKAGGLDSQADIYWLDASLNKARLLVDGEKIYIPFRVPGRKLISDKISLNYATLEELNSLPGVGKTTAKKIIQARPFTKTEELVQKGIISYKTWLRLKKKITP